MDTACYKLPYPSLNSWYWTLYIAELDTAEGFFFHYERTMQHLLTHIPAGKLSPLDQQAPNSYSIVCVCVCPCVCMGVGKLVNLEQDKKVAVLKSKQNEQCYLCVSIYVEFPHWAFLKIPAY